MKNSEDPVIVQTIRKLGLEREQRKQTIAENKKRIAEIDDHLRELIARLGVDVEVKS